MTGYQILRRPTQGESAFSVLVDDTGGISQVDTDNDISGDGHFVYQVKARNAHGLSGESNYVRINRLPE